MSTARSVGAALLAAVSVVGTACSGPPDRPSVAAWEATWERATATVDAVRGGVPRQEECERVLGELRVLRGEALPGPDALVDEEVSAWFGEAEHLFFDCPGGEDEFGRLLDDLDRREAQVSSALDGQEGGAG